MRIREHQDKRTSMLAIELPTEVESRLEALAAKTGCSKEDYARDVIAQSIEDMEDAEIARERLTRPAQRWSLEDLERERDLDS